jgi:hypothetical protein
MAKLTQPPAGKNASGEATFRFAHDYAWSWFSYHANQRLAIFNYSVIVLAALTAACISAFTQEWYTAAAVSAALIAFFAYAFLRMDHRNSDLTKLAEAYLKEGTEPLLAVVVGDKIRLTHLADKRGKSVFYTFGKIVRTLYYLAIIGAIAACIAGCWLGGLIRWPQTGLW